jgi:hypothetical protein
MVLLKLSPVMGCLVKYLLLLFLFLQISVRLYYYLILKDIYPYHMLFSCYLHIIVILIIAI